MRKQKIQSKNKSIDALKWSLVAGILTVKLVKTFRSVEWRLNSRN